MRLERCVEIDQPVKDWIGGLLTTDPVAIEVRQVAEIAFTQGAATARLPLRRAYGRR
jgi:hypothetical protein